MSELRDLVSATIQRLLQDQIDTPALVEAESGKWPAGLWDALEAAGLTQPMVADGGGTDAVYPILHAAGRWSAPVPLAETIAAGWLLRTAGLTPPAGPLTVAPVRGEERLALQGNRVSGTVTRIPWGRAAGHVIALVGEPLQIVVLPQAAATVTPDHNLAREPRDTLRFDAVAPVVSAPAAVAPDAVILYGALLRAVQMAGALDGLLAQSVQYANERVQFGQPIGKFQAVQQQLAVLAEHAAAAAMAAEVALFAADRADARFEIAVAKARVSEAVEIATNVAHAVHGAIGFTYEHVLHFSTRRLWAWRGEFGSESVWQRELGRAVLARGADRLWSDLTAR